MIKKTILTTAVQCSAVVFSQKLYLVPYAGKAIYRPPFTVISGSAFDVSKYTSRHGLIYGLGLECVHKKHTFGFGYKFSDAGQAVKIIPKREYRYKGIKDFADENYTATSIVRLQYAYQFWSNANVGTNYTSLFIDLVDDFNQNGVAYPSYGVSTVNDNVKGYSLAGIESTFLFNVTGVDTWIGSLRGNLKANKPAGVTDAQIDELLVQF